MRIGVVKEQFPGERRVALTPVVVAALKKLDHEIIVESGAGVEAGHPDAQYTAVGAQISSDRSGVIRSVEILVQVRTVGADPNWGAEELQGLSENHVVIGLADPLSAGEPIKKLAETGASSFAMELIPRITRAQSMDVLSSQANIAGYKAVLLAANHLPRMFPMMMTAAGTITPARVFIIGAGVAGLQAIATAHRLGAKIKAYDVRPAVKEQAESLGASFVELALETAEGEGGYAKAMDEEFYRRQRELMAEIVAESDVVITTAAIPGKESPLLVTRDAVEGMPPGSVIVDLAAERGGNCEVTQLDQVVEHHGVSVHGPGNLPATVPYHASLTYSRNMLEFLKNLIGDDGAIRYGDGDEIIDETLLTRGGEVVNDRARKLLGLSELEPATAAAESSSESLPATEGPSL